jgi:acyl carrier protein
LKKIKTPSKTKKAAAAKSAPKMKASAARSKTVKKAPASTSMITTIQGIIARQLKKKPSQITLNAKLQSDLGADSLDALEIVFQLEEAFEIKIAEDEANRMGSVQDIVTYVGRKVKV